MRLKIEQSVKQCYKQTKQTSVFKSYRTNQVFKIFHDLTCKSENLINLH